jgi:hypothetical protein
MSSQHLSDEAVAAFADGVLSGHARERAARHVNACGECRQAVKVQREAVFALRAAGAPELPSALRDRLRTVPMTTPITVLPTTIAADGTPMFSTFAPMAALVPDQAPRSHRMRPFVTTAAVVALAGMLAAGSGARKNGPASTGTGHTARQTTPLVGNQPAVINPVGYFHGVQP